MTVINSAQFTVFLLLLCRTGGWVITVPLFSAKGFPGIAKIGLSVALAVGLTPAVRPFAAGVSATGVFFASAATEVAFGCALGWLSGLMFQAVEAAGGLIDMVSGMSYGALLDPVSGASSSVFSRIYSLAFTAIAFATDSHQQLLLAFSSLLDHAPPGVALHLHGNVPATIAHAVTAMLAAAIEIGAPLIGAMFLTDTALGLLSRFYPQANMLGVSMTAKPLVSMALLGTALTVLPHWLDPLLTQGINLANGVLS